MGGLDGAGLGAWGTGPGWWLGHRAWMVGLLRREGGLGGLGKGVKNEKMLTTKITNHIFFKFLLIIIENAMFTFGFIKSGQSAPSNTL